jgi:hypothetical protein
MHGGWLERVLKKRLDGRLGDDGSGRGEGGGGRIGPAGRASTADGQWRARNVELSQLGRFRAPVEVSGVTPAA